MRTKTSFSLACLFCQPSDVKTRRRTTVEATTEPPEKVCTWLREICSCSCLTVLPGPVWVLLNKIYILFPGTLYSQYTAHSDYRLSESRIRCMTRDSHSQNPTFKCNVIGGEDVTLMEEQKVAKSAFKVIAFQPCIYFTRRRLLRIAT